MDCRHAETHLVALEGLDASTPIGTLVGQLPHLDGLVQAATKEALSVRRKDDRVNTVVVAIGTPETRDQRSLPVLNVPHADALVKRRSGDVLGVRRDGNIGDAVLNRHGEDVGRRLNVPQPDGTVCASRDQGASIVGEYQGVYFFLVGGEGLFDGKGLDLPDL